MTRFPALARQPQPPGDRGCSAATVMHGMLHARSRSSSSRIWLAEWNRQLTEHEQLNLGLRRLSGYRGFVIAALAASGLAALLFIQFHKQQTQNDALPSLLAGQPVNAIGTYRLQNGDRTLEIEKDETGEMNAAIRSPATRPLFPFTKIAFLNVQYRRNESQVGFDGRCEWVVSVDEYNRLWVCVSSRTSRVPIVSVHGLLPQQSGTLVKGFEVVTSTGNWTGIPEQFLKRIRDTYNAEDGMFPEKPPEFTAEQVRLLLNGIEPTS